MRNQMIAAAAMLLAITAARAETPGPEDFLSEADGRLLVERLADTEAALAHEEDEAAAHFAPFVDESGLFTYAGTLPGLVRLELRRSIMDGPADNRTVLDLRFAGAPEAEAFRALLDDTFGPADPSCSDATRSHWSPAPGTSLDWRSQEHDWVDARLRLFRADPMDANCRRSSAGEADLVDVSEMSAFLERLGEEPPPFRDASAMERWLEPYAVSRVEAEDDCRSKLTATGASGEMSGLSGIAMIGAQTDACDPPGEVPHLVLLSSEHDMFAHRRLAEAARAALGPPDAACSNDERDFWALSDEMVVIIRDTFAVGLDIVADPMVMVMNVSADLCRVPPQE